MRRQMHTATQENQRSDRSTSEGGGRDKFKNIEGDFPTCMRQKNDNNDDNTRKNEDLKGKGGGRLKHYNVDGDVPLCLRKTEEKSKDDSSSNKKNNEENESGSKDWCAESTGKKNNEKTKKRCYVFRTTQIGCLGDVSQVQTGADIEKLPALTSTPAI